jgi:hypothetical protein
MSNYGIKISKENKDVKSETDIKNIYFTSGKNTLGVRLVTSYQVTTNSNGKVDTTFYHGFGYSPIFVANVITYNGTVLYVPNLWETNYPGSQILEEIFKIAVSNNYIRIRIYAHHYEPVQGGNDYPLGNQNYTIRVIYFFNEISETS